MKFEYFISLKKENVARLRIKRSEFIATAAHVSSEEKAKEFLWKVSNEYRNATHNCWAYKLKDEEYFSDAGEPSGTAGRPILSSIKTLELDKVCVVVTRYFGGVKLGVKGLREAYSLASKMVLESAQKEKYLIGRSVKLELNYGDFDKAVYRFRKAGYFYRMAPTFVEKIKLTLFVPLNEDPDFSFEESYCEEVPINTLKKI